MTPDIPASNRGSCVKEIQHVGYWANSNNLRLNQVESIEIVFVSPRRWRAVVIPPPAVPRVEETKVLGVTMSRKFSVALHVNHLLVSCASHCLHCALFDIMACRQTLYMLFFRLQSSLNCRMRHLHGFLPYGHSSNAGHNLFWGWRQTVRGNCTQPVPPSSLLLTTQAWNALLAEAPCTRLHSVNLNYFTQWL